ncbi:MAG: DNA translocase FtsK 4TM domain-containing protein [Victivallales bacterium]|nr:DNA translocase FtsK 4TM domain-containing protein [Victivallales bacterium]
MNEPIRLRPDTVLVSLVLALLLLSCCPSLSYHPLEIELISGGLENPIYKQNILGQLGARTAWHLLLTFGLATYPMLALAFLCSIHRLFSRGKQSRLGGSLFEYLLAFPLFGFGLAMLLGTWPNSFTVWTAFLNLHTIPGGVIGQRLCAPDGALSTIMSGTVSVLLSSALIFVSLAIICYLHLMPLLRACLTRQQEQTSDDTMPEEEAALPPEEEEELPPEPTQLTIEGLDCQPSDDPKAAVARGSQSRRSLATRDTGDATMNFGVRSSQSKRSAAEGASLRRTSSGYQLPSLDLLDKVSADSPIDVDAKEIQENKATLDRTLHEFHINANVVGAIPGPQVTLFEVKTQAGIRLSRITQLENNFLMQLKASNLRILAPIPGKDLVGFEVPNAKRAKVQVRGMMENETWRRTRAVLPLLLGKNISGEDVILDLAKAPHLLIAGTTGSGKSVCMNLLITSLLFRFSPEELRLIMVDPKVVEFQAYQNLPHLVAPIINDCTKVATALNWAIFEMERRYRVLAKAGVRNLQDFNRRPLRPQDAPALLDDDGNPIPDRLPFIVIIIDELADIMSIAKKDVENALARIAAKARAVGIHAIIATQRPDVKTLTGTIKSNFPVRIAFKVASHIDSQTIIGGKGAESLLGLGDMLFIPPGGQAQERIQCAMATDPERDRVVEWCSNQADQCFDEGIVHELEREPGEEEDSGAAFDGGAAPAASPLSSSANVNSKDAQLYQATEILLRDGRATISYIQRKMGIGYNSAAKLMEQLESRGIVGPANGTMPREILVSSLEEAFPPRTETNL